MNNENETAIGEVQAKPNVFLGVIGAIAGALIGAVVWVLVYQLGYLAAIAGLAIVWCSLKGYTLLTKSKGIQAIIVAIIVSIVVLIIAHFVCWGIDISAEYDIGILQSILLVPSLVFDPEIIAEDSSIIMSFGRDLLIGIIFVAAGAFPYIKKAKQAANAPEAALEDEAETEQVK